jgi:hypothetical protein
MGKEELTGGKPPAPIHPENIAYAGTYPKVSAAFAKLDYPLAVFVDLAGPTPCYAQATVLYLSGGNKVNIGYFDAGKDKRYLTGRVKLNESDGSKGFNSLMNTVEMVETDRPKTNGDTVNIPTKDIFQVAVAPEASADAKTKIHNVLTVMQYRPRIIGEVGEGQQEAVKDIVGEKGMLMAAISGLQDDYTIELASMGVECILAYARWDSTMPGPRQAKETGDR